MTFAITDRRWNLTRFFGRLNNGVRIVLPRSSPGLTGLSLRHSGNYPLGLEVINLMIVILTGPTHSHRRQTRASTILGCVPLLSADVHNRAPRSASRLCCGGNSPRSHAAGLADRHAAVHNLGGNCSDQFLARAVQRRLSPSAHVIADDHSAIVVLAYGSVAFATTGGDRGLSFLYRPEQDAGRRFRPTPKIHPHLGWLAVYCDPNRSSRPC